MWVLSCVLVLVTPWTGASRLLCPWDFPGKNIGISCHFPFQRSSQPRYKNCVSCISFIGRWILHHCTAWEAPENHPTVYETWGFQRSHFKELEDIFSDYISIRSPDWFYLLLTHTMGFTFFFFFRKVFLVPEYHHFFPHRALVFSKKNKLLNFIV